MSSTQRYNFVFILPNQLRDVPIPFDQFKKPPNEDGTEPNPPYYTYNEFMSLPGNEAVETPSGTHALLSVNATTIFTLARLLPMFLQNVDPEIEIHEGIEVDRWQDENQEKYLWIVTTDPKAKTYNWDRFRKENSLFIKGQNENPAN